MQILSAAAPAAAGAAAGGERYVVLVTQDLLLQAGVLGLGLGSPPAAVRAP